MFQTNYSRRKSLLSFFLAIFFLQNSAIACPLIEDKFVDYNCDQTFKISVVGDSIVYGLGDEDNGNRGGYVKRLERIATVKNLGISGATTRSLLLALSRNTPRINKALQGSDLIIVDIGRNDYFNYFAGEITIEQVVRNIKRIGNVVAKRVANGDSTLRPFVLTGPLIRANRTDQNIYIGELNETIRRFQARGLPAYLQFDENFSKLNLTADNLHPNSEGYQQIFRYLKEFINNDLQILLNAARPDLDADGIYDLFEPGYGMDPTKPDTDEDGTLDGAEVFY